MSVISPSIDSAKYWLQKINELPKLSEPFRILNVCGGHERSISEAGLRGVLPDYIELVPGPGCPVCVCASHDLQTAINFANSGKTLIAYGDMLRVPTNKRDSLLKAKADGADVRPVASPLEAINIAKESPDKDHVFFAAGFETSFAPLAGLLNSIEWPDNLSLLLAGKLTWPAVRYLLEDDDSKKLHGLIAPGHVATIMGARQWAFCVNDFYLPTAVSGFMSESLLQSIYWLLTSPNNEVLNAYPEVVTDGGNIIAQEHLENAFDIGEGHWRGLGHLPKSAYKLKSDFEHLDATKKWPALCEQENAEQEMPKGCQCADVVMARISPADCALFRNGCTPSSPQGPCMVSDEGACQIWFSQGQR